MAFSISRSKLVAMIIATAFFMQNLDGTIVATALPQIAVSFHTSPVRLSAVITAYLLSVAVFLPISGWAADRYGASNVFRAAIGIFTLGSLLCGIANGVTMLTLARILQGMGGAMMIPVGRLVLLRSVSKSEFVEVMTYLMVPSQLGQVLGPPIGGWITTYASWRWAFLVNLPMGLVGIYFATRFIKSREELEDRPLDWAGFLMTGIALSCVLYGVESLRDAGPDWFTAIGSLAFGLALGAYAVFHTLRSPHPVIDLGLLRIPSFNANFVSGTPFRLSYGATVILLPLVLQVGLGMNAFDAGLLIFASALGNVAIKLTGRPILRRYGFRTVLLWNGALVGVATIACGIFKPATPVLMMIPVLVGLGFSQSLQFTCLNTIAYADVPSPRMSGATSLGQMGNQIANTFGVTLAAVLLQGLLYLHGTPKLEPIDFRIAFVVAGLVGFTSIPLMRRLPRNAGDELSGHHEKEGMAQDPL